jgi:hypothetical protein
MAVKVLTIQNFAERYGFDNEVVNYQGLNLIKEINGLPFIGRGENDYTSGNLISLKSTEPLNLKPLYSISYSGNISRIVSSKTFRNRIYFANTYGSGGSSVSNGIAYYEDGGNITTFHYLAQNSDYVLLETGNNRVAFFCKNQNLIKWAYETNLSTIYTNLSGSITVNNPTVFFFWKNYWYIASFTDNKIQVISPDLSSVVGTLVLPSVYGVHSLININNSYLGIVLTIKDSAFSLPTSLLLWDGNWQNIYFHRIDFSKPIRGSALFNGITFIFIGSGNDLDVYTISSSGIKFIKRFNYIAVPIGTLQTSGNLHPFSITAGDNFIAIPTNLWTKDGSVKSWGVLIWFPNEDLVGFIDTRAVKIGGYENSNASLNYFCWSNPNNDRLYTFFVDYTEDYIWFLDYSINLYSLISVSSGSYEYIRGNFYLETQFLSPKNGDYVKILGIEVFADGISSSKKLNLYLNFKDEKKDNIINNVFLGEIDANGYKKFDVLGRICTSFKLILKESSGLLNKPIILRKIKIYYEDEI